MPCPSSRTRGATTGSGEPVARSTRAPWPTYFNFRKASIYGGSNEIQRNIIAQMILGL